MTGRDPRLTSAAYRALRLAVLDRDRWLCQMRGPHCTKAANASVKKQFRKDNGTRPRPPSQFKW